MSNFVYFGTPVVARDTLATLLTQGFVPTLVVTSPDAPRGRGLVLTPSPVKAFALEHNLPVLTPESLDAASIASIRSVGAEVGICVAYGKIFPEDLIHAFPRGVLNVHYSLLPRHRGATPLEAALLAGDPVTGVSIQKMVRALDAGDVVAQQEVVIGGSETARELRPRLIGAGADLLVSTLPAYLAGTLVPTPQNSTYATHSGKLKKEDGLLDLAGSAEENWRKYRAFADTIGTYTIRNGKRIKILTASHGKHGFTPLRVVPEGKKEMNFGDLV